MKDLILSLPMIALIPVFRISAVVPPGIAAPRPVRRESSWALRGRTAGIARRRPRRGMTGEYRPRMLQQGQRLSLMIIPAPLGGSNSAPGLLTYLIEHHLEVRSEERRVG